MAFLRQKKDKASGGGDRVASKKTPKAGVSVAAYRHGRVVRPRVTEKSMRMSEQRVYTFEVFPNANKKDVAEFVRAVYSVEPIVVRIAKKGGKEKFIRGRWGRKPGLKKAYVYLKEGDKIDFA